MNILDFDFVNFNSREKSTAVRTTAKRARISLVKRDTPLQEADTSPLKGNEGERFLRVVTQTSRIERHYDLFQLLQGEEIQHFIPHQVLISAWGDFGGPNLKLDVISAIPGVNNGLRHLCTMDGLLKDLYRRWLVHGRQPLVMDNTEVRVASTCDCALHNILQDSGSLLVHGTADARGGGHCLYLALNTSPIANGHDVDRFRFIADLLITQVDVAFRRVAAPKPPDVPANQESSARLHVLSTREQEILLWVTEGKTNDEISKILNISSFTVKNHMQRIMRKLNATNRTEAVAKCRQLGLQPQYQQNQEQQFINRQS